MNKFYLDKSFFTKDEKLIAENGNLKAYAFAYKSGVAAIKIANECGYFIILPYKGQQIWRAHFHGHDLTMETLMDEPTASTVFLETYGGFMYHCGFKSMGLPTGEHKQHGEIPNVEYDEAYIACGEDENGKFMSVGGTRHYKKSFVENYKFMPEARLYENASIINMNIEAENLRSKPMEYMYLCHINFRPFQGSKLVYSAKCNADNFKVIKGVPDSMPAKEAAEILAYMDAVQENPSIHDTVDFANQKYDPEITFLIKYEADEEGMAHTMQCMPDGYACYVAHQEEMLPVGVRWISNTGDERSMGMVLPATAPHLGYIHAKENGYVKEIPAKSKISIAIKFGLLTPDEVPAKVAKVESLIK